MSYIVKHPIHRFLKDKETVSLTDIVNYYKITTADISFPVTSEEELKLLEEVALKTITFEPTEIPELEALVSRYGLDIILFAIDLVDPTEKLSPTNKIRGCIPDAETYISYVTDLDKNL